MTFQERNWVIFVPLGAMAIYFIYTFWNLFLISLGVFSLIAAGFSYYYYNWNEYDLDIDEAEAQQETVNLRNMAIGASTFSVICFSIVTFNYFYQTEAEAAEAHAAHQAASGTETNYTKKSEFDQMMDDCITYETGIGSGFTKHENCERLVGKLGVRRSN